MAKVKKFIEIPMSLAQLLAAEPDDFKEPDKYTEAQVVAKSLLKVLLEANR